MSTSTVAFDEDSSLTSALGDKLEFLKEYKKAWKKTRRAYEELENAKLIVPWKMKIDDGSNGELLLLDGLYRIVAANFDFVA
jgi:hypothetical protein